jgi:hypothetical protein
MAENTESTSTTSGDVTVKSTPTNGPTGAAATGVQDRVVMASRHADGSHAQSDDFEFIGDKDDAIRGAKHQLVSQAYAALQTSTDPDVNPTEDEQDAAREEAEGRAEAEVNERHKGAFA